jgi:hypothetical protein
MIIPAIAPELKPPLLPPPPTPLLVEAVVAAELGTGEMGEEVAVGFRAEVAEDTKLGPPDENMSKPDETSFQRFCTSTEASA